MANRSHKHILWLIALSLCWSTTFIFVKIADHDFDPITLMAGRAVISFLFLFIFLLITKKPLLAYLSQPKKQIVFLLSGVTIAYMWYSIAMCEKVLTASMTSFLLTALVIFSWIIATFFTREKPFYGLNFLGIILAVFGVITMLGYHNIFSGNESIWYALLYLSGIAVFLIGVAINKAKCRDVNPFVSTMYGLFYAAVILVLVSLIFQHPWQHHYHVASWLSVAGLGLFSTGIGYLIFFWLVVEVGQVFASMNGYLVPVFGFLMGTLLLNEPFYWYQIIGVLFVFVGMFLTERKRSSA